MDSFDKDRYTLLIDSDLYAFSTAIAMQKENPFDPDGDDIFDAKAARMVLDQRMRNLMEVFNTSRIVQCFSCNRKANWRRDLDRTYKMNREGKLAPIGLTGLITYLKNNYEYQSEPKLEADDLLGIYSTNGVYGDTILCSWDKDMKTIPTTIWNGHERHKTLKKQSRKDAFKFFIYQIIVGDSADGYKGIKGVGPKGAQKFLAEHGKNLANIWEPLCELGEKKKHDEEYMLGQARMAHILQDGDYDFETEEVKLWEPSMIQEMI